MQDLNICVSGALFKACRSEPGLDQSPIVKHKAYTRGGIITCESCRLSAFSNGQVNLFHVVRLWARKPASGNCYLVCRFCFQCRMLDAVKSADGLLYIIPEVSQRHLLRAVVMAYRIHSLEPKWGANIANAAEINLYRVAANRFLNKLRQLGDSRWHCSDSSWRSSNDVEKFIVALACQRDLSKCLANAQKQLRYIPILNETNTALVSLINKNHPINVMQASRWAEHFEKLTKRFESDQRATTCDRRSHVTRQT